MSKNTSLKQALPALPLAMALLLAAGSPLAQARPAAQVQSPHQAAAKSAKSNLADKTEGESGSTQPITIEFPNDTLFGWVGSAKENFNTGKKHPSFAIKLNARGKVTLPPAKHYYFRASGALPENMKVLDLLPARYFDILILDDLALSDNQLGGLPRLNKTCYLSLESTDVSDGAFKIAAQMPTVEHLNLAHCEITGSGLKLIKNLPKLRVLRICNNLIKPAYLNDIGTLDKLEWLDLRGLNLSDDDLKCISKLPNLDSLHIAQNRKLTDKCLVYLKGLQNLRGIDIKDTGISLKAFAKLPFPKLKTIQVNREQLDPAAEAILKAAHPRLIIHSNRKVDKLDMEIFEPLH